MAAESPSGASTPAQPSLADQGRDALLRHSWSEALERLSDADRRGELAPAELMLLADAAWWNGGLPVAIEARERAYAAAVKAGQMEVAIMAAIALGRDHLYRAADAESTGWLNRAAKLLEGAPESAGHGWLAVGRAFRAAITGDVDTALEQATIAEDIARRVGDRDLAALAQAERGFALVHKGQREEGMALVDEASVAAVAGELEPGVAGGICCTTIGACTAIGELGRAAEWIEAQDRWCKREGINGYPGMCRLYRSEIKQFRGLWPEAEAEARQASVELLGYIPAAAAAALYRIAVLRLLRGDLAAAEEALGEVHGLGSPTEPALSLVRLAQGRAAAAADSIRRALDEPPKMPSWDAAPDTSLARVGLLRAQVEIALATDDLATARTAVDELAETARTFGTLAIVTSADTARGALELAEGSVAAAQDTLRGAVDGWSQLDAPYEAARARVLLARAYEAGGVTDRALLEMRAAVAVFERLGAARELREAQEALLAMDADGGEAASVRGAAHRLVRTFVFTDIADSTKLAELLGDAAWDTLIRWHDRTVRAVVAEHGGEEVKATGDGFFLAFDDATRAAEAMIALQRRLAEHRETQGFAPAVRVGIHMAEGNRVGADYVGIGVNLAARIGAAASASEILVSEETFDAFARRFADAGRRTLDLKGVSKPTRAVSIAWR